MSDLENRAGAFSESEHKRRKRKLESSFAQEETERFFELQKNRISKNVTRHDILSLKEKIKTGVSLTELRSVIDKARVSGEISDEDLREAEKIIKSLDHAEKEMFFPITGPVFINAGKLPFGKTDFVKKLESSKLGESILNDIIGIIYGFFVQGGSMLGYIMLRLIFDAICLPRDIYRTLTAK